MFLEILQTLIKVLLVFSILIIAFGLAFYILLSNSMGTNVSRMSSVKLKNVCCTDFANAVTIFFSFRSFILSLNQIQKSEKITLSIHFVSTFLVFLCARTLYLFDSLSEVSCIRTGKSFILFNSTDVIATNLFNDAGRNGFCWHIRSAILLCRIAITDNVFHFNL